MLGALLHGQGHASRWHPVCLSTDGRRSSRVEWAGRAVGGEWERTWGQAEKSGPAGRGGGSATAMAPICLLLGPEAPALEPGALRGPWGPSLSALLGPRADSKRICGASDPRVALVTASSRDHI